MQEDQEGAGESLLEAMYDSASEQMLETEAVMQEEQQAMYEQFLETESVTPPSSTWTGFKGKFVLFNTRHSL